jgi:hypothetical protein
MDAKITADFVAYKQLYWEKALEGDIPENSDMYEIC